MAQQEIGEGSGGDGRESSRQIGAGAQGAQQGFLGGVLFGFYEEAAHDGAQNAAHRQQDGQNQPIPAVAGAGAQSESGQDGAHIGLVQVSAHAGHVAHVVAHVVRNGGGVAGVVLRDARLHLAHQVSAYVGSFGVDASAHPGEQSHKGGAHAVHHHDIAQSHRVVDPGPQAQDDKPQGDVQQSQAHHSKAHDTARGEGHPQSPVQALAGGLGGACVGIGGNFHAHQTGQHGPDAAGQKGKGSESGEHLSARAEGHDQKQNKDHSKDLGHRGVLVLEVGIGAGADSPGNFLHSGGPFRIGHDPPLLLQSKKEGSQCARKAQPVQVLHENTPFLWI